MLIPILDDTLHIAREVRRFDPELFVAFNPHVQRYEVHDRTQPQGQTLVMRVQEPDGSYRPLDDRVLQTLMRCRRERFDEVFRELEQKEKERERRWQREMENIAEAMADDLKWMGRPVIRGWSPNEQGRTDTSHT